MFSRLKNWALFRLEQTVIRGAGARLAIMVTLVVLVAVVAGLLARALAPGFESAADAIWWAFLRLTDPGYLGDDEGVAKATISTVVTVLGYVLFMGALIAILVQWLAETMDRLEQGLTPVALDAHFVLLGWTSRTLTILEEILVSRGRVERFLQQRGARRLRVALLAERADASLGQHIERQLGTHWSARQIILRSGSPLRLDGLERVDFAHAGAILIPAADTTASSTLDADTRTVKALMTMGAAMAAGGWSDDGRFGSGIDHPSRSGCALGQGLALGRCAWPHGFERVPLLGRLGDHVLEGVGDVLGGLSDRGG